MNRLACLLLTISIGHFASKGDEVRYFLALEGLSDPNDTDSAHVSPTNQTDLLVEAGMFRFYLWAQLLTPDTDLIGVDLAFRVTDQGRIHEAVIWQNNFVPAVARRWDANGVPGVTLPDGTDQYIDPPPAAANQEAGVTNGFFRDFDDQWNDSVQATVIGSIDVYLPNGEVHIIHQSSQFLSGAGNHRVSWI